MKQRLLVMNGSKILQNNSQGTWQNQKVEKAGLLKPGIYNIYNASVADTTKEYEGVIVHSDKSKVYQQIGKKFVVHETVHFDKLPQDGSFKKLKYDQDCKISMETVDPKKRKLVQKF